LKKCPFLPFVQEIHLQTAVSSVVFIAQSSLSTHFIKNFSSNKKALLSFFDIFSRFNRKIKRNFIDKLLPNASLNVLLNLVLFILQMSIKTRKHLFRISSFFKIFGN